MIRLHTDLICIGEPLPTDVFNKDGQLLVRAGLSVEDEDLYRELLDFGFIEGEAPEPSHTGKNKVPERLLPEIGVLIADDTPLLLDMLEKSLRNLGLERIQRVGDGEMAVSKVGQLRPDMVFLDIDMPRRDGISALKLLRGEFPDLFICMLSGHNSVQNVRSALAAGASGFLVKPFKQQKLQSVVEQFLQKKAEKLAGRD
jgi:two-component system chemotaxis response regulator CheY